TSPGSQLRGATVVAVDGNAQRLQRLQTGLEARELRVVGFPSVAEALESVKAVKPDVMIISTQLPRGGAFDLCRRVRESGLRRHLPVLFLSADCSLEERSQGLMAGGDDFVRLPYDPGELAGRIRGHLLRHSMMKDLLTPKRAPSVPRKSRA
ncbi:MAG TPA: response regulator, partial [Myxococcaceae bacterium]|nr:response regulator [Myxococcaceae bacterium]